MARRRRPRHFQYLDSGMAESYLADLTGGLPEGGSFTERYSNKKSEDQERSSGTTPRLYLGACMRSSTRIQRKRGRSLFISTIWMRTNGMS